MQHKPYVYVTYEIYFLFCNFEIKLFIFLY
jgi:hypothetical protein